MIGEVDALQRLAREAGVLASYIDWKKQPRVADPDVLVAVLAMLGHPVTRATDAPDALHAVRQARWRTVVSPCAVTWMDDRDGPGSEPGPRAVAHIELCLPRGERGAYRAQVTFESGVRAQLTGALADLPVRDTAQVAGVAYCSRTLSVPVAEPGYHDVTVDVAQKTGRCRIIAAPVTSWPAGDDRRWGLFAPAYALRGTGSSGVGDLGTLTRLALRAGELGASFVGTLPLLAAYLDEPFEYSPYSPVSRLFWNELYLDPRTAPGFDGSGDAGRLLRSARFTAEARELRRLPLIDYRREMAHKRPLLDALADAAWRSGELRAAIAEYAQRHPHAEDYARFRAATCARRQVWTQWPAGQRTISEANYDDRVRRYHLYVQFAMDHQLALSGRATGLGHYLDLPIGVDRGSYDTWRHGDLFLTDAAVGAPPDALFSEGQNWGLPPLHPERLRQTGYQYVIDSIRNHVEHAGLLRVDHVMGLHRLYWIPRGVSAKHGVYVHYHAEELYAVLCLESARNRCTIAGENLGTVPDYVPPTMARHGFLGLYVGQFGMSGDPASDDDIQAVPRAVVASLNTHDMPTFSGFWRGGEIDIRRELGLLDDTEAAEERSRRAEAMRETVGFLHAGGFLAEPDPDRAELGDVMRAVTLYLATSDARVLMINVEDLWLESRPQNVPGTWRDRPNWRRPLARALEDFSCDAEVVAILAAVDRARRAD